MRTRLLYVAVLMAFVVAGCNRQNAAAEAAPEEELPTLDVTQFTDKTELFMEYPPLVAGSPALFAIHLTKLADFKAVTAGRAKVEFTPESGGEPKELVGPAPARPGIFRVEEVPPAPGRYRWALMVEGPEVSDRHDLGLITVFPDEASARAGIDEGEGEDAAAISYLKEQQWTNEFATAPVREGEVRASIRVPATIHPLPGGESVVAAPAAGRFMADTLPSVGDRVRPGQVLGRLEPRLGAGPDRVTLEAEVAEARATVEGARVEQGRAERLLAERAVPARRVEDARRATIVAEARLRAAEARLAQRDETLRTGGGAAAGNAFTLRAPIAGRLAEVTATLGASYDEGRPLFRIVRTDVVELELQVPAANAAAAREVEAVSLEIPGMAVPLDPKPRHVHDSGVLDPATRALAVKIEIENPGEKLLVGQAGTAVLYTSARTKLPTVPSAAVLMEAGRPYVFVQAGGEQFVRRFIEIVAREGDLVGVKSGVMPGERVVTRGAYEVQLASAASGLPAEGHVH
jgi:membrane fusion protein, heavy metal efflux system